ncbi:LolA family protein [Rubrivirga sp.]|uniref:LolA family protein n=1 Tax=Rubrivirga sp. TaxID=1885344 RepID=UPI003B5193A2
MTNLLRSRLLGSLALAAVVLVAGQVQAQTPDAVARRLQQRYGAIESLQASFVQTAGGQRLQGTLSVRQDAFRLDLGSQVLVTDGGTLWSYSRDDEQVVVQDYEPARVGFSVGQLFTNYLDVFRVTGATKATIGGVAHDVLTLRPRQSGSSVRDATLYVRSSDAVPTRVRVHDTNGGTLAFDLRDVRRNVSLPASTFRFQAPSGTEVVDLR